MNKLLYISLFITVGMVLAGCHKNNDKRSGKPLFTLMKPSETGVDFENTLTFRKDFNIYKYRNYYNGGGVALGDVNNDGRVDILFTSNMEDNRLYLNKGDFKFQDITSKAKIAGKRAWSTGVSMVDINGDGLLDIYVCNSGDIKGDDRRNELYINNGDSTFTEKAAAYGLDDPGFSIQAAFFDYDRDGDLDMYLLNNSYRAIGSFDLQKKMRDKRNPMGGDKLFRNDGGKFVDVSEQAGIYGSEIGFGLGVTAGDVNRDGWPDLYISNDFFERDYLYINNGDGTFTESLQNQMESISAASMGADEADLNNDGYPEIFATEMLPDQESRLKSVTTFEDWKKYQKKVNMGYYHQVTRNTLQLNNRDGTFSEIGRLAGVEATDWSWGALIMDLDNDGLNDLFVSNGIYQDLTNLDYLKHISQENVMRQMVKGKNVNYEKLIDMIPSNPLPNHAFKNEGHFRFSSKGQSWGLAKPGFSNGGAYGDLDNDGDLDLVINNVNMKNFIYRNEVRDQHPQNRFLEVRLVGKSPNTQAIGAQLTLKKGSRKWYRELIPVRGFESSMDPRLHVGLDTVKVVDSLIVRWPDGRFTVKKKIKTNQFIILKQENASASTITLAQNKIQPQDPILQKAKIPGGINWKHQEDNFNDFDRNKLLFHMRSTEGPKACTGDINGDGLEDIYLGGSKGQPGALFVQRTDGSFSQEFESVFNSDKISEDSGCTFLDANGDGNTDLYVGSGGNEFPISSSALADRLYLNDGQGHLQKSNQLLPAGRYESTGPVKAADFDDDGDMDLFVGIRLRPFAYGKPENGYILKNDGTGHFKNVTSQIAPKLENIGLLTDALWTDYDNDGDLDLMVAGEWMPLSLFRNDNGKFVNITDEVGLGNTKGWWKSLAAVDIDGDGDTDYVAGNHGLNSRFRASADQPVRLYFGDFDGNGIPEQIITHYNDGKSYPMALRHDLLAQLPGLKSKYPTYASYKDKTTQQIFGEEALNKATEREATQLASVWIENLGNGKMKVHRLPFRAQFSPMYAILPGDFDGDGKTDLLLGGNLNRVKPEVGSYNASYGVYLHGDGKGHLTSVPAYQSGFKVRGRIRALIPLNTNKGNLVLVARNNDSLEVFKPQKMSKSSAKR